MNSDRDQHGALAADGPDRVVRPILVAGFGRFSVHRTNPASILVEELEGVLSADRFVFQPRVPVDVASPDRIACRADREDAKAIVVFGLSEMPFRAVLRLERSARRKVFPSPEMGRLKGIRSRLAEEEDERREVDERFVSAAERVDRVSLGTCRSAGCDVCNWTLYSLAGRRLPAALVHVPWLRPCEGRLGVAKKLLEAIALALP